MALTSKEKVLLIDFMSWLALKIDKKMDYIKLINEYQDARYGLEEDTIIKKN